MDFDAQQVAGFFNQTVFSFGENSFTTGQLILTPLLLIAGILVARWFGRKIVASMTAAGRNADLIHLVQRVYFVIVLLIVLFTILELLNVPLTSFAFISGAVAIGIGFGAQNIINNFISGWILLWERPIRIGDFLELGETRGTVEAINTRSTRIRRLDGVHLLIPNSHLLENTVVNWTLIDKLARSQVRVGVAYGSPVEQVSKLIQQAADEHNDVLEHPKSVVLFEDFGDSALVFELVFWAYAQGDRDLRMIRSDLRYRIDALFRENGIVISFPQRDVHLTSQSPVQVQVVQPGDQNG